MFDEVKEIVGNSQRIVVLQPENPDGDSLASALALENIFSDLEKDVTLYCPIDMPKYLRYIPGWDRIESEWTGKYDCAIIVDTAVDTLLEKTLEVSGVRNFLETHPVIVFDHHVENEEGNGLSFSHTYVSDAESASTSELLYETAVKLDWPISADTAELMYISIASDTLGLTTPSATAKTFQTTADLVKLGAVPSRVEEKRREFMRKPADILTYKGQLISRIVYHCNGRLAVVHIPWEDIEQYSDRYNPSVLVLDEMRLVEGVDVAVAIKTYPDGKLTGKIRTNLPIADTVAGYFGGGGHAFASGFKIYETLDKTISELVHAVDSIGRTS